MIKMSSLPVDMFSRQTSVRKASLIAGLLAGFASLAFAEKAAELNDDFIEYLGQMEDNDDNWSDFVDDAHAREVAVPSHAQQSSASSLSSASSHYRDDSKTSGRSHP